MNTIFSLSFYFFFIWTAMINFFYIFVQESRNNQPKTLEAIEKDIVNIEVKRNDVEPTLKYILQWTDGSSVPFIFMGKGQQAFIEKKCRHVNCFVTDDINYFNGDVTKFDAIVFNAPEINIMDPPFVPQERSSHQKYVFASIESSDYYPTCSNRWNGFYNWTWTFKLDSDSRWGYFVVRDVKNNVIGPNKEMHWIKLENMDPVSVKLRKSLEKKTKVAAWFVSNCVTRSKREDFVTQLQIELKKYNLRVDVYGGCGVLKCTRDNEPFCYEKIRQDYHFYLSFENAFSEDYVTEKLMHALKNDAIPIVYGEANYTRFMPDGIYLNAREMGVQKLAATMHELMHDINKYAEYFRWKNHYSYYGRNESLETDDNCGFCTLLNDDAKVKQKSIYENLHRWWDPPGRCYDF